jgi:hypothetical protein
MEMSRIEWEIASLHMHRYWDALEADAAASRGDSELALTLKHIAHRRWIRIQELSRKTDA